MAERINLLHDELPTRQIFDDDERSLERYTALGYRVEGARRGRRKAAAEESLPDESGDDA